MLRGFVNRCLSCLFAVFAHPLLASGTANVVGEAYDLRRGDLLYREHHFCDLSGKTCRIVYRNYDGQDIARKTIDYSNSELAPALLFNDLRFSQEISLDLSRSEGLVVDAGFDNFMRSRWEDLSDGLFVDFRFRVVGRDKPLEMIAHSPSTTECEQDKLCLEVKLDSWYLSLLSRPIQLTYDRDSQRLVRYRGISNIRASDGGSQDVEIVYHYRNSIGE